MQSTPELLAYIREQLSAGFSKDVIRQAILSVGWDISAVDSAFNQVISKTKIEIAPDKDSYFTPSSFQEPSSSFSGEKMSSFSSPSSLNTEYNTNIFPKEISSTASTSSTSPNTYQNGIQPIVYMSPEKDVGINQEPVSVPKKRNLRWLSTVIIILIALLIIVGGIALAIKMLPENVISSLPFQIPPKLEMLIRPSLLETEKQIPKTPSLTGNYKVLDSALSRMSETQVLHTTTSAILSTLHPNVESEVQSEEPKYDEVDITIQSERKRDRSYNSYRLMTNAHVTTDTKVELDADLDVVNKKVRARFNTFTLIELFGIPKSLKTWITTNDAVSDIILLDSIGLPGGIVSSYLTSSGRRGPALQPLLRTFFNENSITLIGPTRIPDTTNQEIYHFVLNTRKLADSMADILRMEGALSTESEDTLRKFVSSFSKADGDIIINTRSKMLHNITFSIEGFASDGSPMHITGTVTFTEEESMTPFIASADEITLADFVHNVVASTKEVEDEIENL